MADHVDRTPFLVVVTGGKRQPWAGAEILLPQDVSGPGVAGAMNTGGYFTQTVTGLLAVLPAMT